MAHKDLGIKNGKHRPGCVTRHVGTYIEGNVCSHRWHAAKKARGNPTRFGIGATDTRWKWGAGKAAKLKRWARQGKATAQTALAGGATEFTLQPFATAKTPWPNNAHHIIPRSTLAGVWEKIAQEASPRQVRCFNCMVTFALIEEYNINDEPNMVMLPVLVSDSDRLGLPRHLEGGLRNHPDYNDVIKAQVSAKLSGIYAGMVSNLQAKKHINKINEPSVKGALNGISEATYGQILSIGAANKAAGGSVGSLDEIAPQIQF